jgi:hypothetical protein
MNDDPHAPYLAQVGEAGLDVLHGLVDAVPLAATAAPEYFVAKNRRYTGKS